MKKEKESTKKQVKTILSRPTLLILAIAGIATATIFVKDFNSIEQVTPEQAQPAPGLVLETRASLPYELVCMVNDAYMGKKQFPVPVGDQMYYGCCEMCVSRLQNNRELRYALDPFTGEEVDKAKAFIVLKDEETGAVSYFKSEDNYKKYNGNNVK